MILWWKKPTRKELLAEVERLKGLGETYGPVDGLAKKEFELKAQVSELQHSYAEKKVVFDRLRTLVERLEGALEWEDIGIYEPLYSFETSDEYKKEIKRNSDDQKRMVSDKTAAVCDANWTVDGSRRKGETMTNQSIRLALRAFNNECSTIINKATWKNFNACEQKIDRAYTQIEKLNASNKVYFDKKFVKLKKEELRLTYELASAIQDEKEEARRIRELERENVRAEKEIAAALKKVDDEEARYQEALAQARAELGTDENASLKTKISELEAKIERTHSERERAQSMAEITRSGYVYVISNIGSFGDRVFKVGMTRRIDPMDRVRELGDASVPFTFDVHAMVWAEDAPNLEREIHKRLDSARVNRVNYRKEFFEGEMSEIKAALQELKPGANFSDDMEAEQYRVSLKLSGHKSEADFPDQI